MLAMTTASCVEDEEYSTSTSHYLMFSTDTVSMDTAFSNIPTPTHDFWVYNKSGKSLRNINVALEKRGDTGFRVNVDGSYLGAESGYQLNDIEVRDGDSIRVFVELTSRTQNSEDPKLVEDNLVFTLESGVKEKINLNAYSWDATRINGMEVSGNDTLASNRPVIIYKGITVDEGATLHIMAGTTLYFHQDAGIMVKGTLLCEGTAENAVTLRGDRIDNMFSYLPYDFTPGQWQGITLAKESTGNIIDHTDLHSAYNGIVCDSTGVENMKLSMNGTAIHNCQGYGLKTTYCRIEATNCQFSNTLGHCVDITGGTVTLNNCTLAQFYPFSADRGGAINFCNKYNETPLPLQLTVTNSLITGYADDVLFGTPNYDAEFSYTFDHCMIRTPKVVTEDSIHFVDVIYEDVEDTTMYGQKHFRKMDTDNLRYDFRLDSVSAAIGKANPATASTVDRDGMKRDDMPDMGCYEWREEDK